MVLQIFVRKDFDPVGVLLLDPGKVRVVTLGSDEFLELEAARRGKSRLTVAAKAGETLVKLGRRYGLTPGDLARINRFSYNTELHEGQRIVVYSPMGAPPRDVAQGMASPSRRDRGVPTPARSVAGKAKPGARTGKGAPAKSEKAVALRATGAPPAESKRHEEKREEGKSKAVGAHATTPPPFEPRSRSKESKESGRAKEVRTKDDGRGKEKDREKERARDHGHDKSAKPVRHSAGRTAGKPSRPGRAVAKRK